MGVWFQQAQPWDILQYKSVKVPVDLETARPEEEQADRRQGRDYIASVKRKKKKNSPQEKGKVNVSLRGCFFLRKVISSRWNGIVKGRLKRIYKKGALNREISCKRYKSTTGTTNQRENQRIKTRKIEARE